MRIDRRPGAGLLGVLMLGTWGCSSPSAPLPPPGGGETFVLDSARFETDVAPLLAAYGCNAVACHGGGIRGTYELSPPDSRSLSFDFEQTALQVDPYDPSASPILAEPLAESAGGTPHQHEPFASVDDPDYRAIADWIAAGGFE